MVYHKYNLKLTDKQQKQAINGKSIRLIKSCMDSGQVVMLHPLNVKKVRNAKGGINLILSPGEIMASASYHKMIPANMEMSGEGIFGDIWEGVKKVGKFLKDSGAATKIADALQAPLAGIIGPAGAAVARQGVRQIAGVGIKTKRKVKGSGLYLGKGGRGLYL